MVDPRYSELPLATSFLTTHEWGVNEAGISKRINGEQVRSAWGLDYLGSTVLAAGAHETDVITLSFDGIPATRDFLWVFVRIASYGGSPDVTGDIGSLRFNSDSGANYWTRHLWFDAGTWNDVPNASTTLIRLAETNSRLSRNVFVTINNLATRGKTCNIKNQTGTANAATVGVINTGGGEWVNLVDQITSVQLINAGSNNMGAGSGVIVFGKNF
jgi:hypothetical protein